MEPEDSDGWQKCGLESAQGHAGSHDISETLARTVQDERDPFWFANTELDICIGVHVDDMLAVGPSELTMNLLHELAKEMTMRWCMVNDKPQEFLGRSLCRTPQGYTFGVPCDNVTKLCRDFGFGELNGSNTLGFEKPDDDDTILD